MADRVSHNEAVVVGLEKRIHNNGWSSYDEIVSAMIEVGEIDTSTERCDVYLFGIKHTVQEVEEWIKS